jgi:hypothetical protein
MSLILQVYWPLLLAAFTMGVAAGRSAFFRPRISDEADESTKQTAAKSYRSRRKRLLLVGCAAMLIAVPLWHGPMGGGARFAAQAEGLARGELRWLEMEQITAALERRPLTRTLRLSGSGVNDFQQAELSRILSTTPGVSRVRWPHERGWTIPLLAELGLLSLLPFLAGLGFSYLVEIRRRVNAEWSW